MVAPVPVPVHVTMLNPAVEFTLVVDVMAPLVLVDVVPLPACHCHAAYVAALVFIPESVPKLKPFELNDVTYCALVNSVAVESLSRALVTPRTESDRKLLLVVLRAFCHTRSGWNVVPRMLLLPFDSVIAEPVPVYSVEAMYRAPFVIVGVGRL